MQPTLSVSQFVDIMNETMAATLPAVEVLGEVSSHHTWNQRLVFFELKDEAALVHCMIPLSQLNVPLEIGMRMRISAAPRLTKKGKFSLQARSVLPEGEGALHQAFTLLKAQLEGEGLFADERKRLLPPFPRRIAVVTSKEAAAWSDFTQQVQSRWPHAEILLGHTQVQGEAAPEQIVAAIEHVNALQPLPDALVVIRGGGGLEDLLPFNSESVVRAVASSRVPTVVGIGHERDESLAELAADVRAATPTDAARRVVPDMAEIRSDIAAHQRRLHKNVLDLVEQRRERVTAYARQLEPAAWRVAESWRQRIDNRHQVLSSYDPQAVLRRGYAVVRSQQTVVTSLGALSVGNKVVIQLADGAFSAQVTELQYE